jgi:hypothetical protein
LPIPFHAPAQVSSDHPSPDPQVSFGFTKGDLMGLPVRVGGGLFFQNGKIGRNRLEGDNSAFIAPFAQESAVLPSISPDIKDTVNIQLPNQKL